MVDRKAVVLSLLFGADYPKGGMVPGQVSACPRLLLLPQCRQLLQNSINMGANLTQY